ncbi:hypothetical protein [Halalkalibacter krulwichiae]|uniref:Uncharacterized protein n=1 Tax=Halalkalibacter krulwichiae TaxID=199441 RepID=A0A1X9MKE2_9BACI|nr:hypothetical protein [Halalkalibacter krulwichiae]ARK32121.1 hypothetical protein BkAM31D_21005 [Halalkalibacter krulwichiae]
MLRSAVNEVSRFTLENGDTVVTYEDTIAGCFISVVFNKENQTVAISCSKE